MTILRNFLVSEYPLAKHVYNDCEDLLLMFAHAGIIDSSGIRFYYTDQPPEENVGILTFGHSVVGHMIIPPLVERYTVKAYCSERCLDAVSVLVKYELQNYYVKNGLSGHKLHLVIIKDK